MATHSNILPGESHGQRILVGYSQWGCKESDMTEWLSCTQLTVYLRKGILCYSSLGSDIVFVTELMFKRASLVAQMVKNLSEYRSGLYRWVRKIPWKRAWLPTPVFFPREFHGQRSLESYSYWGCKELDTAEWLTHTYTHTQMFKRWSLNISSLEGREMGRIKRKERGKEGKGREGESKERSEWMS